MIKCQIIQNGKKTDEIYQKDGLEFYDNHGMERSNSIRTSVVDARLDEWHYEDFGIMHQHYRGKEDNSGFRVMHEVQEIILSRYWDMPSLHDLAKMVGTNECTLKKAFKLVFGTTVFQYLFDYRMGLAVRYLLDSNLPIAEIGLRLGYDYQSHFCTAFKRKYGMSLMEYRLANTVQYRGDADEEQIR